MLGVLDHFCGIRTAESGDVSGELDDRPLESITDAQVRNSPGPGELGRGHHAPASAITESWSDQDSNRVIEQLESKLGLTALPLQINIGRESNFEGVVDLLTMEAVYFDGERGDNVRREPIPESLKAAAEKARQDMLEKLSMVSDEIMELLLEEQEVPLDLIQRTIREATIAQAICPVLMGSANAAGGVMGKMIAAQSLVIGCAVTGQQGKEGDVFRAVLKHAIGLLLIVGALVMLFAYVFAWAVPSGHP